MQIYTVNNTYYNIIIFYMVFCVKLLIASILFYCLITSISWMITSASSQLVFIFADVMRLP